ncbi:homocysteine-responsive endoplasmic reticulum-resident ubiquitin-like domain member 2 protein [Tachysurus ichikawai]
MLVCSNIHQTTGFMSSECCEDAQCWLPFNLDNELQDLAEPANHNQEEPIADNHNNTDQLADEGEDEEEQREGPDEDDDDYDDDNDEDNEGWVNMGFLSSAWSFVTTFFASLIPEAVPNVVN